MMGCVESFLGAYLCLVDQKFKVKRKRSRLKYFDRMRLSGLLRGDWAESGLDLDRVREVGRKGFKSLKCGIRKSSAYSRERTRCNALSFVDTSKGGPRPLAEP